MTKRLLNAAAEMMTCKINMPRGKYFFRDVEK